MPLTSVYRLFLRDMKFNIVRGVDEIKAFLNNAVNAVNGRESLLANRRSSCRGLFDMDWKRERKIVPLRYISFMMPIVFSGAKKMVPLLFYCQSATVSQFHSSTLPREMRCGTPEGTVVELLKLLIVGSLTSLSLSLLGPSVRGPRGALREST